MLNTQKRFYTIDKVKYGKNEEKRTSKTRIKTISKSKSRILSLAHSDMPEGEITERYHVCHSTIYNFIKRNLESV